MGKQSIVDYCIQGQKKHRTLTLDEGKRGENLDVIGWATTRFREPASGNGNRGTAEESGNRSKNGRRAAKRNG